MLERAGLRLELAEQQPQQGRLADPVVADESNAIAAHDLDREVIDDLLVAVAIAHVARPDHLAARLVGLLDVDARLLLDRDALGTHFPHLLERPRAALVARAPGLDPLPNPDLFLGQLLVEARVRRRLVFERLFLAPQVVLVVAGPAHEPAAIDLDNPRREFSQERAIVGNEHHGAGPGIHAILEPLDRRDVEMVRRLVEQQQVGLLHERSGKRDATPPAARELVHFLLGREVEVTDDGVDALLDMPAVPRVDPRVQCLEFEHARLVEILSGQRPVFVEQLLYFVEPRADHGPNVQVHRLRQRLRELCDDEVALLRDLAAVRLELARDQLEGRRLAGAVAADQAHALAGFDGELGLVEDPELAEIQRDVIETYQRHAGKRARAKRLGYTPQRAAEALREAAATGENDDG